ncbi:hypothetical protein Dimus_022346, partial [Dionaea muscipula]
QCLSVTPDHDHRPSSAPPPPTIGRRQEVLVVAQPVSHVSATVAVVSSPVVAVKTRAMPILDLDVYLITDHSLDSLDNIGGGTLTVAATSPVPRHRWRSCSSSPSPFSALSCSPVLLCRRRVEVKKKMREGELDEIERFSVGLDM